MSPADVRFVREHGHRVRWALLFALACLLEAAAQWMKDTARNHMTGPPPEQPVKEPS